MGTSCSPARNGSSKRSTRCARSRGRSRRTGGRCGWTCRRRSAGWRSCRCSRSWAARFGKLQFDVSLQRPLRRPGPGRDRCRVRIGALPDSTLAAATARRTGAARVASPRYLRRGPGVPRRPRDVEAPRLPAVPQSDVGGDCGRAVPRRPAHRRVRPACVCVCNDGEALVAAASEGMGIAQVPDNMAARSVASPALRRGPRRLPAAALPIWLVYPSRPPRAAAVARADRPAGGQRPEPRRGGGERPAAAPLMQRASARFRRIRSAAPRPRGLPLGQLPPAVQKRHLLAPDSRAILWKFFRRSPRMPSRTAQPGSSPWRQSAKATAACQSQRRRQSSLQVASSRSTRRPRSPGVSIRQAPPGSRSRRARGRRVTASRIVGAHRAGGLHGAAQQRVGERRLARAGGAEQHRRLSGAEIRRECGGGGRGGRVQRPRSARRRGCAAAAGRSPPAPAARSRAWSARSAARRPRPA